MTLAFPKPRRLESKSYLKWIRLQPCLIHHPRQGRLPVVMMTAHHSIAKGARGSDYRAVPLCFECHRELHQIGAITFAKKHDVNFESEIVRLLEIYVAELEARA